MSVRVFVDENAALSCQRLVDEIILDWFNGAPLQLGGATGRTMIECYRLLRERASERQFNLKQVEVFFLDEYWAGLQYFNYARLHLGVGEANGFDAGKVNLPRGVYFEDGRVVTNARLEEILTETQHTGQWRALTEPGEDGIPPEVYITDAATHPVLVEVRDENRRYEQLVSVHGSGRAALLGIGRRAHVGFVEAGGGRVDGPVCVTRLSPTTRRDNADDFDLTDAGGNPVRYEEASFAVSQGIGSVSSARRLLLAAHGAHKANAVRQLLTEPAGPQNPAGFVTHHSDASVFLDVAALSDIPLQALESRGFDIHSTQSLAAGHSR